MFERIRSRLTYANVMSTTAVFVALGGSSYAALHVDSGDIKDNSIRSVDVRNRTLTERDMRRNSLGRRTIRESGLGRVPHARNADRLGGRTVADLVLACPDGTFPIADVCVETTPRAPAAYGTATIQCGTSGTPAGPGRRLPTHGELLAALSAVQLTPAGELTSDVYLNPAGQFSVLYITDQGGSVASTPNTGAGARAFRCVTDPLN